MLSTMQQVLDAMSFATRNECNDSINKILDAVGKYSDPQTSSKVRHRR